MCIKTTVPVLTDRGLAPPAAAIHGFSRMSRQPLVPATAIVRTPVLAVRQNLRRFMPAATA